MFPPFPCVLDAGCSYRWLLVLAETLTPHCENMRSSSRPSAGEEAASCSPDPEDRVIGRSSARSAPTLLQSLCLFQSCNFPGFHLKTVCLSCIAHKLWDFININEAHYGKLTIERRFFKRWNHNNNDQSVCVAWILRAVLLCSSVLAFHCSHFPPPCGKGVLKERNYSIDSHDYEENYFFLSFIFWGNLVLGLPAAGHRDLLAIVHQKSQNWQAIIPAGVEHVACLFACLFWEHLLSSPHCSFFHSCLQNFWERFPTRRRICQSIRFPAQTLAINLQTRASSISAAARIPQLLGTALK